MQPQERYHLLRCSEHDLLALCTEERFLGSGKGGQKRNKTANAVRLRLGGISVVASNHRSLERNRAEAVQKLRQVLAFRSSAESARLLDSCPLYQSENEQLSGLPRVNPSNPKFYTFCAIILDAMHQHGSWFHAAASLGSSAGGLRKWVERHPPLCAEARKLLREHKVQQEGNTPRDTINHH